MQLGVFSVSALFWTWLVIIDINRKGNIELNGVHYLTSIRYFFFFFLRSTIRYDLTVFIKYILITGLTLVKEKCSKANCTKTLIHKESMVIIKVELEEYQLLKYGLKLVEYVSTTHVWFETSRVRINYSCMVWN